MNIGEHEYTETVTPVPIEEPVEQPVEEEIPPVEEEIPDVVKVPEK